MKKIVYRFNYIEHPDDCLNIQKFLLKYEHLDIPLYAVQRFWRWRSNESCVEWSGLHEDDLWRDNILEWFDKWRSSQGVDLDTIWD